MNLSTILKALHEQLAEVKASIAVFEAILSGKPRRGAIGSPVSGMKAATKRGPQAVKPEKWREDIPADGQKSAERENGDKLPAAKGE